MKENNGPDLDYAWILGETTSELFDKLTIQERWFLACMYEKDPEHAAEELGISRAGYYRMTQKIRRKLTRGA